MEPAGAWVLALTTAVPDAPLTVATTYTGAAAIDRVAVDLVLSPRPYATIASRRIAENDVPVGHASIRTVLDHLARVHESLQEMLALPVAIDCLSCALPRAEA